MLGINTIITVIWSVEWIFRHVEVKITPFSSFNAREWDTMNSTIMLLWILWFVSLAYWFRNTSEKVVGRNNVPISLVSMFQQVKLTLVVAQAAIFIRGTTKNKLVFSFTIVKIKMK